MQFQIESLNTPMLVADSSASREQKLNDVADAAISLSSYATNWNTPGNKVATGASKTPYTFQDWIRGAGPASFHRCGKRP